MPGLVLDLHLGRCLGLGLGLGIGLGLGLGLCLSMGKMIDINLKQENQINRKKHA